MSDTTRPAPTHEGERALVVIDMQHSYFELPGLEGRDEFLVPRINELIRAAREDGRPVFLARTEHQRDRSTWTLNMLEDDQGFAFPGTEQARFLDKLDTGEHIEIVKTRDSCFHGTDFLEHLRRLDVTHLLLCGVSTHSCVNQTASDAFAHDFHAAIAVDAVTSEDPELADAMLEFLASEMRQSLLHQAEALAFLAR
jgi:nicotinamidase-related amidase